MKRFPLNKLQPTEAWLFASLIYNPYSDIPPAIYHGIVIEIAPIEIGLESVDSPIQLSGLSLPKVSWNALSGPYTLAGQQDGSFYVSSAHNPVDLLELQLSYRGDAIYGATAKLFFDFEHEGSGYPNDTIDLSFDLTHRGFRFDVPVWSDPQHVSFPVDWHIPSSENEWTEDQVRTFVGRHCELSQYPHIHISSHGIKASPSQIEA